MVNNCGFSPKKKEGQAIPCKCTKFFERNIDSCTSFSSLKQSEPLEFWPVSQVQKDNKSRNFDKHSEILYQISPEGWRPRNYMAQQWLIKTLHSCFLRWNRIEVSCTNFGNLQADYSKKSESLQIKANGLLWLTHCTVGISIL